MSEYRLGVVGYCPPVRYNQQYALRIIENYFNTVEKLCANFDITIVGLTDVGVLNLAYGEARRRGWRIVRISCQQDLEEFPPSFQVDEQIIVGQKPGDERPYFINYIDMLMQVGHEAHLNNEVELARRSGKVVMQFDLGAQA